MKSEVENKVTVKKFRRTGWLPQGHDGEYQYTNSFEDLTIQIDTTTNLPITGLTDEDERRLEESMRLKKGDLSRYNRDFWSNFRIRIPKAGKTLDLSIPSNELEYKVLLMHDRVANSEAEKLDSPSADYVMTSPEQEAKMDNVRLRAKREAFKKFSTMSPEDMRDFLKVYGKNPGKEASADFVEAQVGKIAEQEPNAFLDIVTDKDFKMKLLITECLSERILVKNGSKYSLFGGDVIGYSLEETINYLSDPANQDVYKSLKAKLQKATKA